MRDQGMMPFAVGLAVIASRAFRAFAIGRRKANRLPNGMASGRLTDTTCAGRASSGSAETTSAILSHTMATTGEVTSNWCRISRGV